MTEPLYNDAYAYLQNWVGNDYEVVATVLYAGLNPGEVELLLRCNDTDASVRTYEVLYNTSGGFQLVRWNGPLGNIHSLWQQASGSFPGLGNGNQIRARIVGNSISIWWRAAAGDAWMPILIDFADDGSSGGSIATGKPGMAIFLHASAGNISYVGLQDYTVTRL